jgi:hypothetical protein
LNAGKQMVYGGKEDGQVKSSEEEKKAAQNTLAALCSLNTAID